MCEEAFRLFSYLNAKIEELIIMKGAGQCFV